MSPRGRPGKCLPALKNVTSVKQTVSDKKRKKGNTECLSVGATKLESKRRKGHQNPWHTTASASCRPSPCSHSSLCSLFLLKKVSARVNFVQFLARVHIYAVSTNNRQWTKILPWCLPAACESRCTVPRDSV